MAARRSRDDRPSAFLSTAWGRIIDWATRHRFVVAYAIAVASFFFLLPALGARMQEDVALYRSVANDLLQGKLPYRDREVEYPPYAIPVFVLPRLFGDAHYLAGFTLLALLGDGLLKGLLFSMGSRDSNTLRSLLPLLLYGGAVPFVRFFYLQRYDIWPTLVYLLAISLFCSGHFVSSGLAIAVSIGVKFYPAVCVPAMLALALRQGEARRFGGGLALGLLPLLPLSLVVPWWRFVEFQTARGLQVESLYASVLWLGKLLGLTHLDWEYTRKWYELHGALASATLPWARGVFVAAVGVSTVMATAAAFRLPLARTGERDGMRRSAMSASQLNLLLLVPLLGFVAFNQVLSPQFMIWILPLAALGTLEERRWALVAVPLATMLTPIIFPSAHWNYARHGLDLFETAVLLIRNLALVFVWGVLVRDLFRAIAGSPRGLRPLGDA